jgi:hypothetical protein
MGCETGETIPIDPRIRAVPPAPALHTGEFTFYAV